MLVAEAEALVLTSTAASSSCSATGGPGLSIIHYFCRESPNPLCISGIIPLHVRTYAYTRDTRMPSKILGEGG
jgi:hypothetical protein